MAYPNIVGNTYFCIICHTWLIFLFISNKLSQNNFCSNPIFLLWGSCTVIQELLYWRQFGTGAMRDVVSIPRHSSSKGWSKSELPCNLRRVSFLYISSFFFVFFSFFAFLDSFFLKCEIIWSHWGIFTYETVFPPSFCIWPLQQTLCSLGPSDL